jgi:hypothetical protein
VQQAQQGASGRFRNVPSCWARLKSPKHLNI